MLRKSLLILLICIVFGIKAEDKTLIITETVLPYTSQTWITTGSDPFPGELINKNWDEGRRITSVAYTKNGWFVTMAKNTGIGMQTYSTDVSWPGEWISKNWNDGYRITSVAKSCNHWCVVMSQGSGLTQQTYNVAPWSEMKQWIKDRWNDNFYITSATYNGSNWLVVMSQGTPYSTQGYFWTNSYQDLKNKAQPSVWDKGCAIQSIESNGSEYFVTYIKYKDGHSPLQAFIENPTDVAKYIDGEWAKSRNISYIGGGYSSATPGSQTTNVSGPGKRTGTFYYVSDSYQQGCFVFYYHNGDYLAQAPGLQNTYNYITRYLMVSESGNEYLFKQAKMNLNGTREILDYAPTMRVSKDWKRIVCQKANILDGSDIIYTKEISKSDYDEISRNKQKYLNRIGIGGGGGYNPHHNHDDGNKGGSSQKKCSECGGSGICQSCHGTGGSWEDTGYYIGKDVKSWIPCPSCNGSKKCFMCR